MNFLSFVLSPSINSKSLSISPKYFTIWSSFTVLPFVSCNLDTLFIEYTVRSPSSTKSTAPSNTISLLFNITSSALCNDLNVFKYVVFVVKLFSFIVLTPFTKHKFPSPYTPPVKKYILLPTCAFILTCTFPIVVGTDAFVVAEFPLSPPPNTLPFITIVFVLSSINTSVANWISSFPSLLKYTLLWVPPPYTFKLIYPPYMFVFVYPYTVPIFNW